MRKEDLIFKIDKYIEETKDEFDIPFTDYQVDYLSACENILEVAKRSESYEQFKKILNERIDETDVKDAWDNAALDILKYLEE